MEANKAKPKKVNLAEEQKKLEELKKLLDQAKERVKTARAVEARAAAEAERKAIDRKKILIGVAVLESIKRGELTEADLLAVVDRGLIRNDERAVFGLPPLQTQEAAPEGGQVAQG